MDFLLILILAVALDLALGEPPPVLHPVVGMGKAIAFMEKGGYRLPRTGQFLYGMAMTLMVVGVFALPAWWLLSYIEGLNRAVYSIAGAWLLKTTFSLRGLLDAGRRVERSLGVDLAPARRELRSLVKRDTRDLPQPLIVSATVESLAENTNDSFVAPLFFYLLLGVPGAVAYRAVNTLDAMIGYHDKYEWLGKFAARLDDLLNLIPARLTALLLVASVALTGGQARQSWHVLLREHGRTASPNAGWPMAAVAGGLGVTLEKAGHYRLGEGAYPGPEAIGATRRLVLVASLLWAVVCILIGVGRLVFVT